MKRTSEYMDASTEKAWHIFSNNNFKTEKGRNTYLGDICLFMDFVKKPFILVTKEDVARYYQDCQCRIMNGKLKGSTTLKKFRELSRFADSIKENMDTIGIQDNYDNLFENYVYALRVHEREKISFYPNLQMIDQLLLAARDDHMYYLIISMVYKMALRPKDICGIMLKHFLNDDNGTYLKIKEKKDFKIIYVPEDICDLIDTYLKDYNVFDNESYLFTNNLKRPLNEKYLERMMHKLTENAGLEHFTLYDLRNASAVHLFAYGASVESVANQLNISVRGVNRYNGILYGRELTKFADKMLNVEIKAP